MVILVPLALPVPHCPSKAYTFHRWAGRCDGCSLGGGCSAGAHRPEWAGGPEGGGGGPGDGGDELITASNSQSTCMHEPDCEARERREQDGRSNERPRSPAGDALPCSSLQFDLGKKASVASLQGRGRPRHELFSFVAGRDAPRASVGMRPWIPMESLTPAGTPLTPTLHPDLAAYTVSGTLTRCTPQTQSEFCLS